MNFLQIIQKQDLIAKKSKMNKTVIYKKLNRIKLLEITFIYLYKY